MFQRRFKFDPKTLRYVQVKRTLKSRLLIALLFGSMTVLLTALIINVTDQLDIRIKYRHLKKVNSKLVDKYQQLSVEMDNFDRLLADYQLTDDSIYRCILGIDPLPAFSRKPGYGGSDLYHYLEGFPSSDMMINTSIRLEHIGMRTDLQKNSFTDLDRLAYDKKSLFSSIPAIQPLSLNDFFWLSSDFGYRIDPFSRMKTFHNGLDFAAEPGRNVYATGDGIVDFIRNSNGGYGKEIIIDHRFGYTSRYAHLQKIMVEPGQKVRRGQVIGLLGNSGRSTGPHLHYGVTYFDKAVNPYFYYSGDLSPEEYNKITSFAD
jgi:murein DD-endopeptidase MepM/ murein hydrolase activator NlpD